MSKKYKILPMLATVVLLAAGIILFAGCEKEKKDSLQGIIIGTEKCSENNVGYLISVLHPDYIGDSLCLNELSYINVVKTYSIPQNSRIVGDTIIGKFQMLPDSLSTRVCPTLYPVYDVPEIIISLQ